MTKEIPNTTKVKQATHIHVLHELYLKNMKKYKSLGNPTFLQKANELQGTIKKALVIGGFKNVSQAKRFRKGVK